MSKIKYSVSTATSVVVANMIGTGVFTCLGFQLLDISDYSAIISLWIIGGVVALCGAFCYAELGSIYPQSGGDYTLLSSVYNPFIGYLSGWISSTIGFAAPIALAAFSLGAYLHSVIPNSNALYTASIVIIGVSVLQSFHLHIGGRFQKIVTLLKVVLVVLFIVLGVFFTPYTKNFQMSFSSSTMESILSWPFAAAMFWVSFAYSGWNAASYIAGEMNQPSKNLPKALILGTLLVTVLYVSLNFVFLKVAPFEELVVRFTENGPENIDTGNVAGKYVFESMGGAKLVGLFISILLISSISAMIIAGPRVISAMGNDHFIFKVFSKKNTGGSPVFAIWLQTFLALVILWTGTFDVILKFTSFVLIAFSTLTVSGLLYSRITKPNIIRPFKTPLYPITPLLFIICNFWFMYMSTKNEPLSALIGIGIVLLGIPFYFIKKTS